MVVPVFITSCQVFENPKTGPTTAHTITTLAAKMNVEACPAAVDVRLANLPKNLETTEGVLA